MMPGGPPPSSGSPNPGWQAQQGMANAQQASQQSVANAQQAAINAQLVAAQADQLRRLRKRSVTRPRRRHRWLRRFTLTIFLLIILGVLALFALNWLKVGQHSYGPSGIGRAAYTENTITVASGSFSRTIRPDRLVWARYA